MKKKYFFLQTRIRWIIADLWFIIYDWWFIIRNLSLTNLHPCNLFYSFYLSHFSLYFKRIEPNESLEFIDEIWGYQYQIVIHYQFPILLDNIKKKGGGEILIFSSFFIRHLSANYLNKCLFIRHFYLILFPRKYF